ncbi:BnaA07g08960D [Brassica napus]|uniref:(rape) hypothetical protein n=1 Tax=Brassica napus TaxID=3708 RepID=A0A078FMP8_BRANA|nr:unnamed protein product [Brassica napus]CDY15725.1 BnaA07g08960D [Brassica napus]
MIRTLERYQNCTSSFSFFFFLLNQKHELTFVLKYYRNLLGEDLGPLSTKELESLERRLDSSLKKIRALRVLRLPFLSSYTKLSTHYIKLRRYINFFRHSSCSTRSMISRVR